MTSKLLRLSYFTMVLFAMGCGAGSTTPLGTPAAQIPNDAPVVNKNAPAVNKPDFVLTAVDLSKEYEANKDAAGKKYKDRTVVLEGVVTRVSYEDENPSLHLQGQSTTTGSNKDPHDVMVTFLPQEKQKILAMTVGQQVKARGRIGGYSLISATVAEGVLVDVGPDPSIQVSPTDLTKAFITDEKSAKDKYLNKWVVVEGTLLEKKPRYGQVVLEGVSEKSGKPLRLECALDSKQESNFAPFKKGDKLKIKGEVAGYTDFDNAVVLRYVRLMK